MKKLLLAFCLIAGAAVAQMPAEIWGGLYNLVRPTLATRQQAVFQMSSTASLRLAVAAFDPAAQALINAMVPTPQLGRQLLINRTIVALKAGGVWPLLDALYLTAAASEQAARLNWVNPATFTLTASGSVAFQVDRGFTGNGVNSYNNTQFTPTTAPSPKYVQDSAHLSVWSNTPGPLNPVDMGNSQAFLQTQLVAGNIFRAQINAGVSPSNFTTPNTAGHFIGQRVDSVTTTGYFNGTFLGSGAGPSQALTATAIALGGRPFGTMSFSTRQLAAASIGASLTAAQASAFYNALAGYMAGVQMGYDPDAKAIIAAMVPTPSVGRQALINSTVVQLKAAGIWDQLDLLYFFAAANQQNALLNWKNPATFTATAVNSPAFAVDRGFTGNGVDARVDSNYTPSTNGVQYTQDNASLWGYSLTAATGQVHDMGRITVPGMAIILRASSGNTAAFANDGTQISTNPTPDGTGLWGIQRRGATDKRYWRNAAQIGATLTTASTGLPAGTLWFCGASASGAPTFSTRQFAFGAAGASLVGREAAFYNIVRSYLLAVGAASVGDTP